MKNIIVALSILFLLFLGIGMFFQKNFVTIFNLSIPFVISSYFLLNLIKYLMFSKKRILKVILEKTTSTFGTTGGKVFLYKFEDIKNNKVYYSRYMSNQLMKDGIVIKGFVYDNKVITWKNIFLIFFVSTTLIISILYVLVKVV